MSLFDRKISYTNFSYIIHGAEASKGSAKWDNLISRRHSTLF